jgi:hypothetical protein
MLRHKSAGQFAVGNVAPRRQQRACLDAVARAVPANLMLQAGPASASVSRLARSPASIVIVVAVIGPCTNQNSRPQSGPACPFSSVDTFSRS